MTLSYIVNAPFDASFQAISNAQVLDTSGEGVTAGSLTAVVSSSTMQIANNVLRLIGSSALANCGLYTTNSFSNLPGVAVLAKVKTTEIPTPGTQTTGAVGTSALLSINDASGTVGTANTIACIFHTGSATTPSWRTAGIIPKSVVAYRAMDGANAVVENTEHWPIGAGTNYEFCIIMGGYNSSGVPYQSGDASTFGYGARYYLRGGEHISPVLMGTNKSINPATFASVYASIASSTSDCEVADFKVVNADSAYLQTPTFYSATVSLNDTFTHSANCVIEFDITRPSAGQIGIRFRKETQATEADTDRLSFTIDANGTCRISTSIDGSATQYETDASSGTIPSGNSRIQIVCDGKYARVYRLNSTSNAPVCICLDTTTQGNIYAEVSAIGTAGAISKLAVYDRYPSNNLIDQVYGTLSFLQGTSTGDFVTLRNQIIQNVWLGSGLPSSGVDAKTTSVANIFDDFVAGSFIDMTPSNLLQTDSWQFDVDNGSGSPATLDVTDTTSYAGRITVTRSKQVYVWRPTSGTSNGKAVIVYGGHGYEWTLFARSSADVDNLASDAYSTPWMVKGLIEAGYTVVGIKMHSHTPGDIHDPIAMSATRNDLKYYIEPSIRVVNELRTEGFTQIFMTGTSGGGWTTTVCSALDERIKCSSPNSNGLPLYMIDLNIGGEHLLPGFTDLHLDFQDLYVMGCTNRRKMLNILNTGDPVLGDQTIYNKSLLPHDALVTAAATNIGGTYQFTYNSANVHGYRSATIASTIAFFDAYVLSVGSNNFANINSMMSLSL